MRILLLFFLFIHASCLFGQKKLTFADAAYEEQIETIMLYPESSAARANLQPSAVSLGMQNLILEFDDIQDSKENYYAKLIHCNYDWTQSTLKDLDFIQTYNEVTINDYQYSSVFFLPYIHYRYKIPPVKIPGNYLVIVYRDGDKNDLILSKRMMVYDGQTGFVQDTQMVGASTLSAGNQQLNFVISYEDIDILNPLESVHVVIRQNQRWDNARMDVKPSFIRDDIRQLEFRFFDQDKQFNGGNEYRFVDFRSINYPGQNTGKMDKSKKPYELFVQPDKSKEDMAYAQYKDINGGYAIENQDNDEPNITGNYILVNFQLNTLSKVDGDVYINGALNNWQRNEENKMTYNAAVGAYQGRMALKQGWYNYQYWVESKTLPGNYFEGSHFETENYYDILVYYRPFQPNADLLIGYFGVTANPR